MIKFDLKTLNKLFEEHFMEDDDDYPSNDEILRRMKAVEDHFRIVFQSREIKFDPKNVLATINKVVKRKKIGQGKSLNYHYYIEGEFVGNHNKICDITNYHQEGVNGELKEKKEKKLYYQKKEVKQKTGPKPKLNPEQMKEVLESNLSQRKLANIYGVSQSTIAYVKNKKYKK